MVHSHGALDARAAAQRFEQMMSRSRELTFAKQPIVERSSGTIIGYVGVDRMEIDGQNHLELGYRLVATARGHGYATEAGGALLALAAETYRGELVTVIDPRNEPSIRTSSALGFRFWKLATIDTDVCYVGRRHITPSLRRRHAELSQRRR